ncbi:MAG: permease [candidate division WOR-3 bacterium]
MKFLWNLILSGLLALKEYIALHVLTCLIPAFLLAGAIVTFLSKDVILKYLGGSAKKIISFPLSAISSIFLAVCSCTVIPIAAGIYFRGGGIGPAFIFLWVAPASNILALIYTGAIIGYDMALSRIIVAFLMSFLIGLLMTWIFIKEEKERVKEFAVIDTENEKVSIIKKKDFILLILLVITLLAPNYLVPKGPYFKKVIVFLIFSGITFLYAFIFKTKEEILKWLNETLWFVKIIFPLLLLGVFIVGILGGILKREWIEPLLGALSYFATLTEAPFVHTLVKFGMGKGPALALLLTGPGASLPNFLAISRIFGLKKAITYAILIIIFGTFSGWFIGNFIF